MILAILKRKLIIIMQISINPLQSCTRFCDCDKFALSNAGLPPFQPFQLLPLPPSTLLYLPPLIGPNIKATDKPAPKNPKLAFIFPFYLLIELKFWLRSSAFSCYFYLIF